MNALGAEVARSWDLDKDNAEGNQCRAFGAPGLMRLPTRLRISWQDDMTLEILTDAGQQRRTLHFGEGLSHVVSPPSRQGSSIAAWQKVIQSGGMGGQGFQRVAPGPGGSLKVVTENLFAGYLRKNGIPYSSRTVLTEYFNRLEEINGDSWLVVTSVVEDPAYLNQPFITSSHFLLEEGVDSWNPTPCQTDPPVRQNPGKPEEI